MFFQKLGRMFHYIKKIILQLMKHGLFINEYKDTTNKLFKELSKSPFEYNNKNYITNFFLNALNNSNDENHKNISHKFK